MAENIIFTALLQKQGSLGLYIPCSVHLQDYQVISKCFFIVAHHPSLLLPMQTVFIMLAVRSVAHHPPIVYSHCFSAEYILYFLHSWAVKTDNLNYLHFPVSLNRNRCLYLVFNAKSKHFSLLAGCFFIHSLKTLSHNPEKPIKVLSSNFFI